MKTGKSWLRKVGVGAFVLAMASVAANAGVISAGFLDSFGVKADNSLWGWGYDGGTYNMDLLTQNVNVAEAQLGLGPTNTMVNMNGDYVVASPTQSGTAKTWLDVVGGISRGFGIQSDGSLWGWGYDGDPVVSYLGNQYVNLYHYEQNGALGMGAPMCQTITSGYTNTNISVWTNYSGGAGNHNGSGGAGNELYTSEDIYFTTAAIYTNSVMNGLTTNRPTQVGSGTSWRQVAVGGIFGLGLQADGSIWSWGADGETITTQNNTNGFTRIDLCQAWGQLGQGDRVVSTTNYAGGDSYSQFTQHYTNSATNLPYAWTYLSTTTNAPYTNAVTTNFVQYARSLNTPTQIVAPTSMVCVAAGFAYSAAIGSDGSLWTWGKNQGSTYVVSVSKTNSYTWFDGFVTNYEHYLMPNSVNTNLVLGLGDTTLFATNVPTRVGSETTWASVSAGLNAEFTLAIKKDGSLWGWGNNGASYEAGWSGGAANNTYYYDQTPTATNTYVFRSWAQGWLGLGSNVLVATTPTRVGTDNDWAVVSAGNVHCLGLKSDGSLWAWGNSGNGRLGIGRGSSDPFVSDYMPVPTRVGADNDWVAISAGWDHSLALKSDGSLWGWGDNGDAELGDQEGDAYEPVKISDGWGYSGPVIAASENGGGDYDGDHLTDFVVYDAATGNWTVRLSSMGYALFSLNALLGGPGYQLVTADFDGDGLTDPAVYQESTGTWKVMLSASGHTQTNKVLGGSGYTPVPADYDGDAKADYAVYNKSTGDWRIHRSTTGDTILKNLGAGCVPVPMDYDGDLKADLAVYESATGNWQVMLSRYGDLVAPFSFGGNNYLAVPMDYDGDGVADPAVYGESTGVWKVMLSKYNWLEIDSDMNGWSLGGTGYIPTPADYDGDGMADFAVYGLTAHKWTLLLSSYYYYRFTTTW